MKIAMWWNKQTFLQKFFVLFLIFSGIFWVLVPASYFVSLPYDPPETLLWGSTFNWGNAKHPPMSGYMLYYFCKLFNFHHFAIFLLGQICMIIGYIYTYKLARCFFDRDKSVISSLLISFYIFYTILVPKFNANIPHVLFLPMMYYYFYRGCFANKWHHWLLFAASAACACLSKYSVGVVGLILAIYIFAEKDARKVLLTVKPYVAAVLFAALMTPHVLHLIKTDFLTFDYIRNGGNEKYGYLTRIFLQIGAVIVPILCKGAVCFVMHILGTRKKPEFKLKVADSKAMWYSGCIIWGQGLFLVFMGILGNKLDTKWTFPLYFTAGIFIMSFYNGDVNEKSKKCFAVLCAAFTIILLTSSFIFYHCKTKNGYHIDMANVRIFAERFYRERTGGEIPFITGSLWEVAMLQNDLKYTVKAAPSFDPILMGLHMDTMDSKGALIVASNPDHINSEIATVSDAKLQWVCYELEYSARFGKIKKHKFYMSVLPPRSLKKMKEKK